MTTVVNLPDLTIPAPRQGALRRNPQLLVLVGPNRIGKTAAVAALPGTFIFEIQAGGGDYLPGFWGFTREKELPDYKALARALEHFKKERQAGRPIAKRICIDHLTVLDDWLWQAALDTFNESAIGRSYAKKRLEEGLGPMKEITELPGNPGSQGWVWLREELTVWLGRIVAAADEVIIIAHIRDKNVLKPDGRQVTMEDIALSGKVGRKLFVDETSAVARCRREMAGGEDQFILSFKCDDNFIPAAKCAHLSGREIVVGRSRDKKPPVFSWDEIYLPEAVGEAGA